MNGQQMRLKLSWEGLQDLHATHYTTRGAQQLTQVVKDLIYEVHTITFQTFFRMGTFIDSTHMKL